MGTAVAGALQGGGDGVLLELLAEVGEGVGCFGAVHEFDCQVVVVAFAELGDPKVVTDVEALVGRDEGCQCFSWRFCIAGPGAADYQGLVSYGV